MPRSQKKRAPTKRPPDRRAGDTEEIQGFWHLRAAPFRERWSLVLALELVAIAVARIVAAYSVLGITSDEPVHLACGLE